MDKKYWENYYKAKRKPPQPSLFAQFILKEHLKPNHSLLELGCGNGRDAIFFAQNSINVVAIDQCESEIKFLTKEHSLEALKLECADFTKLKDREKFDYIYSRFTLHSIKSHEEDNVIDWSHRHLKNNGKLLIEARSKKNELYKLGVPVEGEPDAYIYNNHYRRFIDTDILIYKLKKTGFEIEFFKEENGFGGETDQRFFRMIAIKK